MNPLICSVCSSRNFSCRFNDSRRHKSGDAIIMVKAVRSVFVMFFSDDSKDFFVRLTVRQENSFIPIVWLSRFLWELCR